MPLKLIVILDDDMDREDASMLAIDIEDIDGIAEVEGLGFPLEREWLGFPLERE